MNDTKLGQLITGQVERDCVHIAIAPVEAGEPLEPGVRVALVNGVAMQLIHETIGIVDPFLTEPVKKGQRFWLLLYQQTITGMRHSWQHPAFPETTQEPPLEASKSERWLRDFAANAEGIGLTYKELMDAAKAYLERGEDYCFGDDINYSTDWEVFWYHYKKVTGVSGSGHFFSCAC